MASIDALWLFEVFTVDRKPKDIRDIRVARVYTAVHYCATSPSGLGRWRGRGPEHQTRTYSGRG